MPTLVGDRVRAIPDTPTVTWWARDLPPWEQRVVERPVDGVRTRQLATVDDRVRLYPGVPLQLAASKTTTTFNREIPGTLVPFNPWPTSPMPFPEQTWVDQWTTDFMWFGIDPVRGLYWEATEVGPFTPLRWLPAERWSMGYMRLFNLSQPWDKQRVGLCGGGLPMWPMVPRIADLDAGAGGVRHALHLVVSGGYSSDPFIPPARKTDGIVRGHPLRAGARLRLTVDAYDRLSVQAKTPHDAAVLWAQRHYGVIVNDRTLNGHACRLPADPRLNVTVAERLTDFEVLF
jgi:hypothetical protein